jgi:hypothetical protein
MNKRGEVDWALADLAKLIMSVLMVIILLVGAGVILHAVFSTKITPEEKDWQNALITLQNLKPGEREEVVTSGKDYLLQLFPAGNTESSCKGVPCLCVQSKAVPTRKCKTIPGAQADCKDLCVITPIDYTVKEGKPIFVCRKGSNNNELSIGDTC